MGCRAETHRALRRDTVWWVSARDAETAGDASRCASTHPTAPAPQPSAPLPRPPRRRKTERL